MCIQRQFVWKKKFQTSSLYLEPNSDLVAVADGRRMTSGRKHRCVSCFPLGESGGARCKAEKVQLISCAPSSQKFSMVKQRAFPAIMLQVINYANCIRGAIHWKGSTKIVGQHQSHAKCKRLHFVDLGWMCRKFASLEDSYSILM